MARTFIISADPENGRFHFHDTDGLWLPLNSGGYATPATALRALRRFYVVEATSGADTFTATRRTALPLADVEAMHRTGVAAFEADRDREAVEAPAPVAAPAPAPEFFRLIGHPEGVFRVVARYMAAERIPSVRGVTLDGERQTCARMADVEFCADPAAPAPVAVLAALDEAAGGECGEIADGMSTAGVRTFDDALRVVRAAMPDESHTVTANTAEALLRRATSGPAGREAAALAYEADRDTRESEPHYTATADALVDVRAAFAAGWRFDAASAVPGDWPWFRSVTSDHGGPLDVRAVFRGGEWRLYVESAAEAVAEWPYVEAAPMVAQPVQPHQGRAVVALPRVIEAATRDEFDAACAEACDAYGAEAPDHDCTGGVLTMRWPLVSVRWRFAMIAVPEPVQVRAAAEPWPRPLIEINPRPAPVLDVLPPVIRHPFAPVLDVPAPSPRPMGDVLQSLAAEFGPPAMFRRPALSLQAEPRGFLDGLSLSDALALYVGAIVAGLAVAAIAAF